MPYFENKGVGYFDCLSGISGDRTLVALVDAGVPPGDLQEAIAAPGADGIRVTGWKKVRNP